MSKCRSRSQNKIEKVTTIMELKYMPNLQPNSTSKKMVSWKMSGANTISKAIALTINVATYLRAWRCEAMVRISSSFHCQRLSPRYLVFYGMLPADKKKHYGSSLTACDNASTIRKCTPCVWELKACFKSCQFFTILVSRIASHISHE